MYGDAHCYNGAQVEEADNKPTSDEDDLTTIDFLASMHDLPESLSLLRTAGIYRRLLRSENADLGIKNLDCEQRKTGSLKLETDFDEGGPVVHGSRRYAVAHDTVLIGACAARTASSEVAVIDEGFATSAEERSKEQVESLSQHAPESKQVLQQPHPASDSRTDAETSPPGSDQGSVSSTSTIRRAHGSPLLSLSDAGEAWSPLTIKSTTSLGFATGQDVLGRAREAVSPERRRSAADTARDVLEHTRAQHNE